jgi:hypothetical protein
MMSGSEMGVENRSQINKPRLSKWTTYDVLPGKQKEFAMRK